MVLCDWTRKFPTALNPGGYFVPFSEIHPEDWQADCVMSTEEKRKMKLLSAKEPPQVLLCNSRKDTPLARALADGGEWAGLAHLQNACSIRLLFPTCTIQLLKFSFLFISLSSFFYSSRNFFRFYEIGIDSLSISY